MISKKILILLSALVITSGCANRSEVGAVLGAGTTTAGCVAIGVDNPYADLKRHYQQRHGTRRNQPAHPTHLERCID